MEPYDQQNAAYAKAAHAAGWNQVQGANAAMAGNTLAATPRDLSQHELIQQRLSNLRERYGHNTQRMIELGSRAFGGSPIGEKAAGAVSARPQAAGSLAAILSVLDDLEQIAALQLDAITFADRIA